MGNRYVANFDVVAQSLYSGQYFKDMQHMFRKFVCKAEPSQAKSVVSQQTNSGRLLSELFSPGPSTSQVGFIFDIS